MVYQGWATILSLLVSGSMIFTLMATLVLYTQYKLSQRLVRPAQAAVVQKAEPGLMTLEQAMLTLQDAQEGKTHEVPLKKKIRFGNADKRVISGSVDQDIT